MLAGVDQAGGPHCASHGRAHLVGAAQAAGQRAQQRLPRGRRARLCHAGAGRHAARARLWPASLAVLALPLVSATTQAPACARPLWWCSRSPLPSDTTHAPACPAGLPLWRSSRTPCLAVSHHARACPAALNPPGGGSRPPLWRLTSAPESAPSQRRGGRSQRRLSAVAAEGRRNSTPACAANSCCRLTALRSPRQRAARRIERATRPGPR